MKLNNTPRNHKGFSLIEMLVVIAVIGIIAAIAVPSIGRINDSAKQATDRRNAQNIASVFSSGQAAGLDFIPATDPDVAGVVEEVIAGDSVNDATSPFNGTFFGLPGLNADTAEGAEAYLTFDEVTEQLIYSSN
jgi:prepilin-type N-terminal cleavage/methylation domain-containing protein